MTDNTQESKNDATMTVTDTARVPMSEAEENTELDRIAADIYECAIRSINAEQFEQSDIVLGSIRFTVLDPSDVRLTGATGVGTDAVPSQTHSASGVVPEATDPCESSSKGENESEEALGQVSKEQGESSSAQASDQPEIGGLIDMANIPVVADTLASLCEKSLARFDQEINETIDDAPESVKACIIENLGYSVLEEMSKAGLKWRALLGVRSEEAMMHDDELNRALTQLKPQFYELTRNTDKHMAWLAVNNIISQVESPKWQRVHRHKAPSVADHVKKIFEEQIKHQRFENDVDLQGITWSAVSLKIAFLTLGKEVEEACEDSREKVIYLTDLTDRVRQVGTKKPIAIPSSVKMNLERLEDFIPEGYLDLLNGGFSETGKQYAVMILMDYLLKGKSTSVLRLDEPDVTLSKKEKKRLSKIKEPHNLLKEVRKMGMLKTIDDKANYESLKVIDIVNYLCTHLAIFTEGRFTDYAAVIANMNKGELLNCNFFSFCCHGSGLMKSTPFSKKTYRLVYERDAHYIELRMTLTSLGRRRGEFFDYRLEITGGLSLRQTEIVRIFSCSLDSPGTLRCSLDDICKTQNDTWDELLMCKAFEAVMEGDYTIMNYNSVIPMMALAGVQPASMDSSVIESIWSSSLESIMKRVGLETNIFADSDERMHMLQTLSSAICLGSAHFSYEDVESLIMQFFLWAICSEKVTSIHGFKYEDYMQGRNCDVIINAGLTSQALWAINCFTGQMNRMCRVGYRYIPIILIYNMFVTGSTKVKLMDLGAWISSAFNHVTDRNEEDKQTIDLCRRIGVSLDEDEQRRLRAHGDVGYKIISIGLIINERLSEIKQKAGRNRMNHKEAVLALHMMLIDDSVGIDIDRSVTIKNQMMQRISDSVRRSVIDGDIGEETLQSFMAALFSDINNIGEQMMSLVTLGSNIDIISEDIAALKNESAMKSVGEASCQSVAERKLFSSELIRESISRWSTEEASKFTSSAVDFHLPANTRSQSALAAVFKSAASFSTAISTSIGVVGDDVSLDLTSVKLTGPGVLSESSALYADGNQVVSSTVVSTSEVGADGSSSVSKSALISILSGVDIKMGMAARIDPAMVRRNFYNVMHEKSKTQRMLNAISLREGEGDEVIDVETYSDGVVKRVWKAVEIAASECYGIKMKKDERYYLLKYLIAELILAPVCSAEFLLRFVNIICDVVWDMGVSVMDKLNKIINELEQDAQHSSFTNDKLTKASKCAMMAANSAVITCLAGYKFAALEIIIKVEQGINLLKSVILYLIARPVCDYVELVIEISRAADMTSSYRNDEMNDYPDEIKEIIESVYEIKDDTEAYTLTKIVRLPIWLIPTGFIMSILSRPISVVMKSCLALFNVGVSITKKCYLSIKSIWAIISSGCNKIVRLLKKIFSRSGVDEGDDVEIKERSIDVQLTATISEESSHITNEMDDVRPEMSTEQQHQPNEEGSSDSLLNDLIVLMSKVKAKGSGTAKKLLKQLMTCIDKVLQVFKRSAMRLKNSLKAFWEELDDIFRGTITLIQSLKSRTAAKIVAILDTIVRRIRREGQISPRVDGEAPDGSDEASNHGEQKSSTSNGTTDSLGSGGSSLLNSEDDVEEMPSTIKMKTSNEEKKRENESTSSDAHARGEREAATDKQAIECLIDNVTLDTSFSATSLASNISSASGEAEGNDEEEKITDEQVIDEAAAMELRHADADITQETVCKETHNDSLVEPIEQRNIDVVTTRVSGNHVIEETVASISADDLAKVAGDTNADFIINSLEEEQDYQTNNNNESSEDERQIINISAEEGRKEKPRSADGDEGLKSVLKTTKIGNCSKPSMLETKILSATKAINVRLDSESTGRKSEPKVVVGSTALPELITGQTLLLDVVRAVIKQKALEWKKGKNTAEKKLREVGKEFDETVISAVGELEEEKELQYRGERALCSNWSDVKDVLHQPGVCKEGEDASVYVAVLGKKVVVIHDHLGTTAGKTTPMDVYNSGNIAVLTVPSEEGDIDKSVMHKPDLTGHIKTDWTVEDCCSIPINMAVGERHTSNAVCTVVKNKKESCSICLAPSHVIGYGNLRQDPKNVDDLICLAYCSENSEIGDNGENNDYTSDNAATIISGKVYCEKIIGTKCEEYKMAVTEVRNWKGNSGSPVISKQSEVAGLCLMQVYYDGGDEVVRNGSLVLCSGAYEESKPILLMRDAEVVVCQNTPTSVLPTRADCLERTCRTDSIFGEVNKCNKENIDDESVNGANKEDADETNDNETVHIKQRKESLTEKMSRFFSCRSYNSNACKAEGTIPESETADDDFESAVDDASSTKGSITSKTEMSPTSSLDQICKIATLRPGKDGNTALPISAVLKNMIKLSNSVDDGLISKLGGLIINEVIKALVTKEKLLLVCATNTMEVVLSCMLTAMRIKFDRHKSVVDVCKRMSGRIGSKFSDVGIITCEDILISVTLGKLSAARNVNTRSRCIVICPDNSEAKLMAGTSCKALAMKFENIDFIGYSSIKGGHNGEKYTAPEETKTYQLNTSGRFQNEGLMTMLTMNSLSVNKAGANERIDNDGLRRSKVAVFTSCQESKDFGAIARRAAKELDMESDCVIVFNNNSLSIGAMWEAAKTCSTVVIFSGSKADASDEYDIIVGMGQEASTAEVRVMMDALRISSLTFDSGCKKTSMSCEVTTPDCKRKEFRSASQTFASVIYKGDKSVSEFNLFNINDMVNSSSIGGVMVMDRESGFENEMNDFSSKGELAVKSYRDRDILGEEITSQKKYGMGIITLMIEEYYKLIGIMRWKLFCIARRCSKTINNRLDSIKRKVSRIISAFCLSFNSATRNIRGLYNQLKAIIRGIEGISIGTTAGGLYDERRPKTMTGVILRTLAVFLTTADIVSLDGKKISDEAALNHAMVTSTAWLVMETCLTDNDSWISRAIENIGKALCCYQSMCTIARILLGWYVNIRIGRVTITTSNIVNNRKLASRIDKFKKEAKKTITKVEVCPTSLIIDMKNETWEAPIFLHAANACNAAIQWLTKILLRWTLKDTMCEIWRSIKSRNENFKGQQLRRLDFAPCVDMQDIIACTIVSAGALGLIIRVTKRQVEAANATIGVVSEKKNVPDMILIYLEDRELFNFCSRVINFGFAIYMYRCDNVYTNVTGVIIALSTALDVVLGSSSSLGVGYRLGHALSRMYYSRSKWTALSNAVMAWYYGKNTTGDGINAIVLTSDIRRSERSIQREKIRAMKKAIAKAITEQNLEKQANSVLMNKKNTTESAYEKASKVILGNTRANNMFDQTIWEFDSRTCNEAVNLSLIARKGAGMSDWDGSRKDIIVRLSDVTTNQCRYLGRIGKMAQAEVNKYEDYVERQSSVLALNDNLWKDVISDDDRKGYEAAGDSRLAVIMAIAERNDMPIFLDVEVEIIKMVAENLFNVLDSEVLSKTLCEVKVNGMDWLTIIKSANEKSTSGILSRKRSGLQLTAAYLPKQGHRAEIMKEILIDNSASEDLLVVDVFAKRRIEKTKTSRLTGEQCVITRTIQAHEVDLKLADVEAYLFFDKVLKAGRCDNELAIGLNFFIEYANDDLNIIRQSNRCERSKIIMRVSLDHSSFDGSQRNWSIELCKQVRLAFAKVCGRSLNSNHGAHCNYISKAYDALKIRIMLMTSGDMFAVTGQQMSGHSTTSSDNSLKSRAYAKTCGMMMSKQEGIDIVAKSMRAQGDDTKFDVAVNRDFLKDDYKSKIAMVIHKHMEMMGQNVKEENIKISEEGESCSFLSHDAKVMMFLMSDGADKRWAETCLLPMRDKRIIFAMLATTLKATKVKTSYKKKKDVGLLAAKAMSYLMMYVGDVNIVAYCCVVIWICFKVLTALKMAGGRININEENLPWLARQSEIEGEFGIDLIKMLEMHGVTRRQGAVMPFAWITKHAEYEKVILKVKILLDNAKKTFKYVKNWEEEKFLDALKTQPQSDDEKETGNCNIHIGKMSSMLGSIENTLKFSIAAKEMTYKPYVDLKSKIVGKDKRASRIVRKVLIWERTARQFKDESTIIEVTKNMIAWDRVRTEAGADFTSKEGLRIVIQDCISIINCSNENEHVLVVSNVMSARMIKIEPWHVHDIIVVKEKKKKASVIKDLCIVMREYLMIEWQMLCAHEGREEIARAMRSVNAGKATLSMSNSLEYYIGEKEVSFNAMILFKRKVK